jgi:hypothetical protein
MGKISLISIILLAKVYASHPLIFVHGQKGAKVIITWLPPSFKNLANPDSAWPSWNGSGFELEDTMDHRTALDKIRMSGYGGYTPGKPFNCHVNTELITTGGETRKLYNFSFYRPDGWDGVIGSYQYLPAIRGEPFTPYYYATLLMRTEYLIFWAKAHWAYHFAIFVEKVLKACYGDNWRDNPEAKVDVVAHSMGGLVVRAAIKWYEVRPGRLCSLSIKCWLIDDSEAEQELTMTQSQQRAEQV